MNFANNGLSCSPRQNDSAPNQSSLEAFPRESVTLCCFHPIIFISRQELLRRRTLLQRQMLVFVKNKFRAQDCQIKLTQNAPIPPLSINDQKVDPRNPVSVQKRSDPKAGHTLGRGWFIGRTELLRGALNHIQVERWQLLEPKRIVRCSFQSINGGCAVSFTNRRTFQLKP